jgi:hypothetical protein
MSARVSAGPDRDVGPRRGKTRRTVLIVLAVAAALAGAIVALAGMLSSPSQESGGPPSAGRVVSPPLASTVGRASRFVSPRGSDANRGTARRPWRTLAKAARSARAGDTVVLMSGTYGARGRRIEFERSGTRSAPITFRGAGRPTILGGIIVSGDHVRLRGLVFDGPTGPVLDPESDNPGGEDVQIALYGDGSQVARSEIRNNRWHAGIFVDDAEDVSIVANHIHDNGAFDRPDQANLDHGIYFAGGSGVVANNLIEHNLAFGVHLYPDASGVIVTHNTIVRHGRSGVIIADQASDNVVVNNIVARNAQNSIRSSGLDGKGNIARNNIVWANGGGNIGAEADGIALADNRQADPRLDSAWRPSPRSPAIDSAIGIGAVGDDISGRPRPDGRASDVGAYEVR